MNFTPGALGFDPLGFYSQESAKGKLELETKEINNGRLAMIAIAFFAAAEFAGNTAIVDQTPWMFTEGPLANAGILLLLLPKSTTYCCCYYYCYCYYYPECSPTAPRKRRCRMLVAVVAPGTPAAASLRACL